jgi:cytidylate kinase
LKDKGSAVSLPALSREIAERDERDSTRAVAPLRPAPDALLLDSTGRSVEQVVGTGAGSGAAALALALNPANLHAMVFLAATHGRVALHRQPRSSMG